MSAATISLGYFRYHQVIRLLTTAKCAGNDRINRISSSLKLNHCVSPDMWENIGLAKLDQRKLRIVAMGEVVFQGVSKVI